MKNIIYQKFLGAPESEILQLEKEFLKTMQTPEAKPDGIDGFLVLLGEGLRRLPIRSRNKLQIKLLQMLEEEEDKLENN